jgi:hypothetical protein
MASMGDRYPRIMFSTVCGIACVLPITLWVATNGRIFEPGNPWKLLALFTGALAVAPWIPGPIAIAFARY